MKRPMIRKNKIDKSVFHSQAMRSECSGCSELTKLGAEKSLRFYNRMNGAEPKLNAYAGRNGRRCASERQRGERDRETEREISHSDSFFSSTPLITDSFCERHERSVSFAVIVMQRKPVSC